MYIPPGMAPGGFPAPYMSPQYLQLAQAAQQAAMGGRGAGGRGNPMGGLVPGMQPQMGAVPGIRGGQTFPQGAGRGAIPGRSGQPVGQNFPPQARGPAVPQGTLPSGVDMSTLSQAPPQQQKQMLGEALYPKIQEMQPELAGKITGMLLEMDNSELINLTSDEAALRSKVEEAMNVYDEYVKNKPETEAPKEEGAKEEAKEEKA